MANGYLGIVIAMVCIVIGCVIVAQGGVVGAVWRDPQFSGTGLQPYNNTSSAFGVQLIPTHNWAMGITFLGFDPLTVLGVFIELFQVLLLVVNVVPILVCAVFGIPAWVGILLGTPLILLLGIFLIFFFKNSAGGWDW